MKISVTYFRNEAKLNAKTGKIPIYMRVSCKRAKSESRLNIEISQLELLKWNPMMMRLEDRNHIVNHHLNRLEQKFQEFKSLNSTQLSQFDALYIKNHLLGNEVSRKYIGETNR